MIIRNKETNAILLDFKNEHIICIHIQNKKLLIKVRNEYDYIQYLNNNFRSFVNFMQSDNLGHILILLNDDIEITY